MIKIRALLPTDDRKTFSSGNIELDRFFIRYAGQNQFKHHIGTTYVAAENDVIHGFATVSAASIEIENLSKKMKSKLPNYPLPILRLSRLAVNRSFQGQGIGLSLLKYVLCLALKMSSSVGCIGVVVDAKPEVVAFFDRYGFFKLSVGA